LTMLIYNLYKPDKLIDSREAARWMFPREEVYNIVSEETRGHQMTRWLRDHGVRPVAQARRYYTRNRISVYRLGDVVDALCAWGLD